MSEKQIRGVVSRRTWLAAGAAVLGAAARGSAAPGKLKITIFSKHLQFLKGEELAKGAAEIGFDGVDITVRKGGHVEPERVRQDLPPLVGFIRKHGLDVPMITSDIVHADSPHAEAVLQTIAELGIPNYRWGGLRYSMERPIDHQIREFKVLAAKLAELNGRHKVCAMYHTHSGVNLVGASIWDLLQIMEGLDPSRVGVNYDIGHATIEGGVGGWINSFRITGPYLRGVAVKDYTWEKDAKGSWRTQWRPLGEGLVRFSQFLPMLAAVRFSGPFQHHLEFPLASRGLQSSDPKYKEEVFATMRQDLQKLRQLLGEAGLA